LDEAIAAIDQTVIYTPYGGGRPQAGVITEVRSRWVFVRYGSEQTSKATMPQDLRLWVGVATG
jgi:hypothetical protein